MSRTGLIPSATAAALGRALGAAGLAIVAIAPGVPVALVGTALFGVGSGSFLAVDWALMTDIIPKVAAGRYMGISNVATASSGVVAVAVALGIVMDRVTVAIDPATGPRAAMIVGIICYGLGALLLRPVQEPRAGSEPGGAAQVVEASTPA